MAEFTHNGVRYRELPNGQAEVIGPVADGGTYIPPSTTSRRTKEAEANQAQSDAQRAAIEAQNRQAQLSAELARAQADVSKAPSQIQKTEADAAIAAQRSAEAAGGIALTDQQRGEVLNQYRSLGRLASGVNELRQLYGSNLTGRNPLEGRLGQLRPQDAVFNDASGGLSAYVAAALGLSGQQFNTPAEQQLFIGSILPRATDNDDQIVQKLNRLDDMVKRAVGQGRQVLGISPERDPLAGDTAVASVLERGGGGSPPPSNGVVPPTAPQSPAAPQTEIRADGSLANDPALAGANARVNQMLTRGASEAEVRAFLNSVRPGMGDQAQGIAENVEYIRKNPGFAPQVDVEQVWTPAGGVSEFIGNIANNPVGAGIISAGNAATFGNLANLAGGDASLVMEGMRGENPLASLTGDVIGSGLAMGGVGGIAAKAGVPYLTAALTRGGGIGGDMLYGGIRGASETEGGLGEKAAGGLFGLSAAGVGNRVGNSLVSGAGRAARGVSDPAVRMLNERGISMTPGQIIGQSGFLGRNLGRLENAIESVPFIGGNIRARREQGIGDYGRAQLQENLSPIGYTPPAGQFGGDMLADAQQAAGDAYGFLDNRAFSPDNQVVDEITQALSAGRAVPRTGEEFGAIMDRNIGPLFDQGGNITGRGFQDALQTLRGARSDFSREGAMGNMAGDAVSDVEAALMGMVQRQAPDATEDLARANQAYAGLVPIENASITATNSANQFTPAQYGRAAVNNTRKFGGRGAAARGDIPGGELQQAAQQVLPSEVPNSGTTDRAMAAMLLPAALGGGGVAASQYTDDPTLAIILGLLAAGTTRTGQQAAQRALINRPEALRQAGEQVYQLRDLGGRVGSAIGAGSIPWLLANE